MTMAKDIAIFCVTFICGAMYECCCVFWVHFSEKNKAWLAVIFSVMAAIVTLTGIESVVSAEQLARRIFFSAAYALGYGAGTYVSIKLKAKWLTERPKPRSEKAA
jgi:uncharacterized protein YebE (UPF0316 family)